MHRRGPDRARPRRAFVPPNCNRAFYWRHFEQTTRLSLAFRARALLAKADLTSDTWQAS